MSEITLRVIEDLLDIKLDEKLDSKLAPIIETLNKHTTSLDTLLKREKIKDDEKRPQGSVHAPGGLGRSKLARRSASNRNSRSRLTSQRGYFLALFE